MKPLKTLFRVEPKDRGDSGEWLKKHLTPAQFAKFRSERGRLFADSVEKLENYGHGKSTHTTYKVDVPEIIAKKIARPHPDGFTEYLLPKKYVRKKSEFARIDRGRVEMSRENLAKQRRRDPIGQEAGIPLTGQIAHDRYVIENRRKDVATRDSNILRAGLAGTAAGAVLGRGRFPLKARLAAGAAAGVGSVIGVRAATQNTGRDVYGARQPWASRTEAAPAVIGAGAAGYGLYRLVRKRFKLADARFEFAKKEKRQMNPYVMAGISGTVSGAALGILPLLRRGTSMKTVLRTAAGGAAAGGAITGGGSLLGSKILGDPNNKEGAAFTKRAALGGAMVGTTIGLAGGLAARRVPMVRRKIDKLAKEWRPARMIQRSGSLKAAALGGLVGGGYGLAQGADEGQQVDSIRNIRKDLRLAAVQSIMAFEKPFHGYNKKRHAKTGGLNDNFRQKYNRENGSKLKRPVTTEPSKLKPGSKSAKRRASFCARMGGMQGPTSKDGKLTPKGAALKRWNCSAKVSSVQFSVGSKAAQKFFITRSAGRAEEGTVVGKASSLKSARRVKNKHDLKYGATAHKIVDQEGKPVLFAQKDWRDARRESRSEAAKDVMVGGGALAAGAGVGGGALWAARKFGQNADKAGAAAEQVTATMKGVTKPRFVRARQFIKKQLTTFPTFNKAMKKFRLESTARMVEMARYDKMAQIRKIAAPTSSAKDLLAKVNAKQPSWKRGLKNKLRNALDMLSLENKQRLTEFYMLRKDLTEEQRNVRNAVVAGAVGVGAATGVAVAGLRSLKKADEAMRQRYSSVPVAPATLPGMSTPKAQLTPTRQDKWAAAQARAFVSSKGSGRTIRIGAPQAMARQAEARRIKEVRAVARAPIADATAGSRATTKGRIAQGRQLQKSASVANAGVLSRGERLMRSSALAALRKKYRFEHKFSVRYRDKDGRSTGWKSWAKGETVYDENMTPTKMGIGSLSNSMSRYAQKGWRESRRAGALGRDLREVAQGKKTKKREWEKSYFKDRVAGALGTAGLIAGTVIYRKGGKFGAPKWAQKWHGAVNKVGGGIQSANQSATGWLNRQVNMEAGVKARMFAATREDKKSLLASGIAGSLPGMVAGGILAGRKGALAGTLIGSVGGVAARRAMQKRVDQTQSNLGRYAMNQAIPFGLAASGLGLAIARPSILKRSERAGRAARKMGAKVRAKMPVSKATQDARFAKAKPARAWEVGGSQAAPSNWPRLAMESRMNATLRMFEGYGPYQDYYSAPGWDLRDARGKSARVFAPGAKRRERRQAEWHEKKDNQKKLIAGAGVAAALLAGGGGFMLGKQRALRLGKLAKTNAKFRAKKSGGFGGLNGNN